MVVLVIASLQSRFEVIQDLPIRYANLVLVINYGEAAAWAHES